MPALPVISTTIIVAAQAPLQALLYFTVMLDMMPAGAGAATYGCDCLLPCTACFACIPMIAMVTAVFAAVTAV